jgi:diadenylate cyclase
MDTIDLTKIEKSEIIDNFDNSSTEKSKFSDKTISKTSDLIEEIVYSVENSLELSKLPLITPEPEKVARNKKGLKKEKQLIKLEILKKLSSGTGLREGLNDIVKGKKGAIIAVFNNNFSFLFQGGFKVNCKFTSKRLTELAKMDGAIVLSEDFKKILFANALLIPDSKISSIETGTRHQAAERTAKQANGLVIAVSERRGEITIYNGNSRYVLQSTEDLLRRSTETLHILEKQREIFDELLISLNISEVTCMVSVNDVCNILQKLEIIKKMTLIINEYIVELGSQGIILRMRMREITKGIDKIQSYIISDYSLKESKLKSFFDSLNFEALLDSETIAKVLFDKTLDSEISPKGYRILNKLDLSKSEIESLIRYYKSLDFIINADSRSLQKILKAKADFFKKDFNHLKEQIMVGKRI